MTRERMWRRYRAAEALIRASDIFRLTGHGEQGVREARQEFDNASKIEFV